MTMQLRPIFVSACGFIIGCSSAGSNPGGNPDASHSPSDGRGGGDGSNPIDGSTSSPDATGPMNGIYSIPLTTPSGGDQGEFYMPALTVSGKTFKLDLDTGSTVTGIAGAGCSTCSGMSPLYTPGSSASATGKKDQASYADNSGWSGSIYSDTAALDHGTPSVPLDFVDITSQSTNPEFFAGNEYQGIFGMGPAALLDPGTTAYFDAVTSAGVANVMGFELCPTDGTMWLGGFDESHVASPVQYTPLLSTGVNASFYSVDMTAMAIGGTNLGVSSATFDNPIIDTGTSLFYIPSAAQTALVKDLNANAAFKSLFSGQTLTDPTTSNSATAGCVTASAGTSTATVDAMLPKLSLTFSGVGGGSITITAAASASYFYDTGGGQFCLAVYGGGDQGNATMGDAFMRGFVTVIDLANKKIGFAPTSHCAAPEALGTRSRLTERGRGPHHVRPEFPRAATTRRHDEVLADVAHDVGRAATCCCRYPPEPITFSGSCVPAVDERGCPSDMPTIGASCDRPTNCLPHRRVTCASSHARREAVRAPPLWWSSYRHGIAKMCGALVTGHDE